MRRIGIMMLALAATCVFSGAMASTSLAKTCEFVAVANSGEWTNSTCTVNNAGMSKEWIKVIRLTERIGQFFCAEVALNKGLFQLPNCTGGTAPLNYLKVEPLQFWQRAGERIGLGEKLPIKLQLKGTATLTAPNLNNLTIECKNSVSEGGAIEGQGKNHSGQDKGRITFSSCKTKPETCEVAEPIKTNQTKSHLAISESNQAKIAQPVDVFAPTIGKVFTELKISGSECPILLKGTFPVDGSVAAEVLPEGAEVKEGDLQFPKTAISEVYGETEKEKIALTVGGSSNLSTFSAGYGTQLGSGEAFGVGG
jgi:hypothetical protein